MLEREKGLRIPKILIGVVATGAMLTDLPNFENYFLEDLVFSLRKRRKSLAHQNVLITCDKVYEKEGTSRKELAEITLEDSIASGDLIVLRLSVWTNRWVWVDARRYEKKRRVWVWEFEGRLLGAYGGRGLIDATEKAYLQSKYAEPGPVFEEIEKIWKPILATGPKLVRGK